ncbi:hypothetical protein QYE76_002783 [Lolium multiflorum]|uniref:CCHC-type domain-containing protein n=1 Tax=Lolium multiflorum TaxID=4521 RepID=A0AAD8RMD0_LOLMU|nr:hypothetical protein QYE76_002783 [Lolium multiflorum]
MLKCPIHELPGNVIIDNFYARLSFQDKTLLDTSCSGSFTRKNEEFKRDLLDRIQENTEGWENDKDRESGIIYDYKCIEAFMDTDKFRNMSATYGLDSQVVANLYKAFASHYELPKKNFDKYHEPYKDKVDSSVNKCVVIETVDNVIPEAYIEKTPFPVKMKEYSVISSAVNKSEKKPKEPEEQIKIEPAVAIVKDLVTENVEDGHIIFCEDASNIVSHPNKSKQVSVPMLSVRIGDHCYYGLCDIGASVSAIPYELYTEIMHEIGSCELEDIDVVIHLANRETISPIGIVRDVEVLCAFTDNLKYAHIDDKKICPVIISSKLSEIEEERKKGKERIKRKEKEKKEEEAGRSAAGPGAHPAGPGACAIRPVSEGLGLWPQARSADLPAPHRPAGFRRGISSGHAALAPQRGLGYRPTRAVRPVAPAWLLRAAHRARPRWALLLPTQPTRRVWPPVRSAGLLTLSEEIKELEAQVLSLKKDLEKRHEGKSALDKMLSVQQSPNDKSGLGFNSNNKNKSKSKSNKKKGQDKVKDPAKLVCFKCKVEGHHVRSCPLKKKKHLSEKQQGKRPQGQGQAHARPQVEDRPLPKKNQDVVPQDKKKRKGNTCYLCRVKGHFASSCLSGTLSNPIIVDDDYSLGKDKDGNVFAKFVGTQSGLKKRTIWVAKPIVTNLLGPNLVGDQQAQT